MERTVPTTETEEVELYVRTYYSLLRSSAEVRIRTLEEVHTGMKSLLHPLARDPQPDMAAFIYTMLRLPDCMFDVNLVVLGQSAAVFARTGFGDIFTWEEVAAPARRRRCFFNGKDTLACLIASRSDIDDIIPILTGYQIEWNKLHFLLQDLPGDTPIGEQCRTVAGCADLAEMLGISPEDFERLYAVWGENFGYALEQITRRKRDLRVQLLSGSLSDYRRATHSWWENIIRAAPFLRERPVYFLSSNIHSLMNILTGFPLRYETNLQRFLEKSGNAGLLNEWRDIQTGRIPSSAENFLYYVFKKFIQTSEGQALEAEKQAYDQAHGILRIPGRLHFDVEAQVVDIGRLNWEDMDPRLKETVKRMPKSIAGSDAVILNIDYPLGLAAYNILAEVAENVGSVLGVYVMGKAATLNGVIGDVMIPNVVHDEHSQNTYLFPNCFSAADVAPYLIYGTVLDHQKAVTVQGTFLQNVDYMDVFYREGYTDIEMEAGPYLSAVYEMYRPTRHPVNEIANLYEINFDLGIIHYASDTPLSKGKNLGAANLSYHGMDATYASTLAILKRVFAREGQREVSD